MIARRHLLLAGLSAGVLSATESAAASPASRFSVSGDQFYLDGKPFQILAGEMHYPRIPRDSWRDRLRKLKALGLNTLTTYVFWNAHEVRPGVYDFTGNLDVAAYIRMAQEEGLWVNLRPGPYVCAEWDGGGLPAWLFPTPGVRPRSSDPRYLTPVKAWLKRLGQELAPLLIDKGGPIILTQVENEYGAFGDDQAYLQAMLGALRDGGFSGMVYTADPSWAFAKGAMPGIVGGINFGTHDAASAEFAKRAQSRPEGPYFCSELWGGWFDSFGQLHQVMPAAPLMDSLKWMLDRGMSISFYMLHGGTSFGFSAGANWNDKGYQPQVSSYDYDALLDEGGRPTPKYFAVQALFRNYLPAAAFSPMPEPEPSIVLPRLHLTQSAPLAQLEAATVTAPAPLTFEGLEQSHGLVLYRHTLGEDAEGLLAFDGVRDFAIVSVDGQPVATLNRIFAETSLHVAAPAGANIEVLVEAMGHCNYGPRLGQDQKGLVGGVRIGDRALTDWRHVPIPLDDISGLVFSEAPVRGPAFHRTVFHLDRTGYTFLDMRGWGKGYAWINGHNLGRFWQLGPSHSLFVPGSWLRVGDNELVVLDVLGGLENGISSMIGQVWDLPGTV